MVSEESGGSGVTTIGLQLAGSRINFNLRYPSRIYNAVFASWNGSALPYFSRVSGQLRKIVPYSITKNCVRSSLRWAPSGPDVLPSSVKFPVFPVFSVFLGKIKRKSEKKKKKGQERP